MTSSFVGIQTRPSHRPTTPTQSKAMASTSTIRSSRLAGTADTAFEQVVTAAAKPASSTIAPILAMVRPPAVAYGWRLRLPKSAGSCVKVADEAEHVVVAPSFAQLGVGTRHDASARTTVPSSCVRRIQPETYLRVERGSVGSGSSG